MVQKRPLGVTVLGILNFISVAVILLVLGLAALVFVGMDDSSGGLGYVAGVLFISWGIPGVCGAASLVRD